MDNSFGELEQQAKMLPPDLRARLAEVLLESLGVGFSPETADAWSREIEERVKAYDMGQTKTTPAKDVFAEARCLLK